MCAHDNGNGAVSAMRRTCSQTEQSGLRSKYGTDMRLPVVRPHYETADVRIDRYVVGPFENNVFIVRCKRSGEAAIVDAANEHELLLEVAQATGVRRVLTTHGHWDHIQAIIPLRDAGIDIGIAAADASMLPSYDFVLDDDTGIRIGAVELVTLHTPGHTPGSTCFQLMNHPIVFSGDTLFPGGPGTTALPGGDFPTVMRSIEDRLFALAPETLVFTGHGRDTTIGAEQPHFQTWLDRGW